MTQLEDVEWSELIVTMYHENSSSNTVFIGEVKLSLLGPQQRIHAATNAWYVEYDQSVVDFVFECIFKSFLSNVVCRCTCSAITRLK